MSGMHFACQMPGAAQIQSAIEWLEASPDLKTWALMDTALLDAERVGALRERPGMGMQNAFAGSPLVAFGDAAPCIVALPDASDARAADVKRLVRVAGEAPALSWLRSDSRISGLQEMFAYLARVRIASRKALVHCRVADTRVLPGLLRTLSPAQQRRVATVVQGWSWLDREGQFQAWTPTGSDLGEQDGNPVLHLSPDQFHAMQSVSEADRMFPLLMQRTPELVPASGRGRFHRRLTHGLEHADARNVKGVEDRMQFLVLCLVVGDDFHQSPEFEDTWRELAQGTASLVDLMRDWDESVWRALDARKTDGKT